eukprot:TRINITY_DN66191_c5_g4_i1.p2 TRINITY_DN66191_c5_g4~~TRINITY_DN66191_c5_g4_i1.p2  ORF type:complete len:129 (-),score=32.51 TRINITY_DN66191_c5_g4_i1:462-848(-)
MYSASDSLFVIHHHRTSPSWCIAGDCAQLFSGVCKEDVISWKVSQAQIDAAVAAQADAQIQTLFSNFQGSPVCQQWFKSLWCKFMYPKCDNVKPHVCKSECDKFEEACPGAMTFCDAFETKDCYTFTE